MLRWLDAFVAWLLRPSTAPTLTVAPSVASSTPSMHKQPEKPVQTPVAPPTPLSNREKLYNTAKSCLNTHQTLNPSVPNEVGCAEAWSSVAKKAGVLNIPATGIAGTSNLYAWLVSKPAFKPVTTPLPGDTIISPTGHGNGTVTGHVGFIGETNILSNNSDNGLFQTKWTLPKWKAHYGVEGALPVKFFRWV